MTQGAQALPYGNAALEQERKDLIDDGVRWLIKRERTRCSACRSSWWERSAWWALPAASASRRSHTKNRRLHGCCEHFIEQGEHSRMSPHVVDADQCGCAVTWTQGLEREVVSSVEVIG